MTVDGFRLVRQLPGGRHGAVWQAVDIASQAPVALKQMLGVEPSTFARVRAEVDRLRGLADRHLVRSHPPAAGADECWLVEDWVEGVSLAAVQAGSDTLTRAQALGIIRGALLGLSTAHRDGIAHGELSPRSVLIDTDGEPVVVGFGAHLADATVADADGFAGPEAAAQLTATPTADVFSVGRMLDRLLAVEGVPDDLAPVVARSTARDPASRYPDAAGLLADLEERAERAYGSGWWTTAGLSGIVAAASATAATATVGAAASGSGAVAGALSSGSGALAGAGRAVGSGVVHGGRTGLIIAGTAVGLIVMVVAAVAVLRPDSGRQAGPEAAAVNASQSAKPAATTQARTTSSTRSASPKPTPKADPAVSFTGTYRYVRVVTKSNRSDTPVGERYRTSWQVSTTCQGSTCTSSVTDGDDDSWELATGGGSWKDAFTYKVTCIITDTGKETGEKVKMSYSQVLTPKTSNKGVVSVVGTARRRQLQKCSKQVLPKDDIRYKITITTTK